jgi:hypothetical protein
MAKLLTLACVLVLFIGSISAQEIPATPTNDTTSTATPDSLRRVPFTERKYKIKPLKRFFSSDFAGPRKAALLSLVPGGGQIYNRKLWYVKVPVIYGGIVGLGLVADFNSKQYHRYGDAYIAELRGEEHEFSSNPVPPSASTLKRVRDIYDKRRQLSYVGISAVYLLNILEAYVTAQLLDFDISEDLSLRVGPSFDRTPTGHVSGGLSIQVSIR